MFRIEELLMTDFKDNKYTYKFSQGINYFIGSNNTGKTEFYKFIDFMFGSGMDIKKYDWYRESLKMATMKIVCNDEVYWLTRTEFPEQNYYQVEGDVESESIGLAEYKIKVGEIFSHDEDTIRKLRDFAEENISFRTFTMFNFLGEKGQGMTRDFLDKCRDVKYSIKLAPVLNYLFNDNIKEISEIKKQIEETKDAIMELEIKHSNYNFAKNQIANNLLKINSNVLFNGHNGIEVLKAVSEIMDMKEESPKVKDRSISELEVIYSNLSEQIKNYDYTIKNYRQNEKENENRKLLVSNLQELIKDNPYMQYLISPLQETMNELDGSITFGKYIISDETIKELKNQREQVKIELKRQNSKYQYYHFEEKAKAVALIQAYLQEENKDVSAELEEKKRALRDLKKQLQEFQNDNNSQKLKDFSNLVTSFYIAGKNDSEIIKKDTNRNGFKIEYIKRGNILQPVENDDTKYDANTNLYLGSMARHTLIQLAGYLAFGNMLVSRNDCPFVPILVIDHLSKPFSDDNKNAIGKILEKFYKETSKNKVQIFMFDDKLPEEMGVDADHCEELCDLNKTGFNPFFRIDV